MSKASSIALGAVVSMVFAVIGIRDSISGPYPCDVESSQLLKANANDGVRAEDDKPQRPDYIIWVSPAEAAASPKPDWWHVTDPVPGRCAPCILADRLFTDISLVRWSEVFDCIRADKITGKLPKYPVDIFTSADGKKYVRYNGCPDDVRAYKWRFYRAYTQVKGEGQ